MRPAILCAIPEHTYRRVMTPEVEARLHGLGDVTECRQPASLSEEEYAALWEGAEAVVTGWGVRAPTPAILDRARRLRIISHTAGSVRMIPRYAIEKGVVVTSARAAIARTVAEFCLLSAMALLRQYPSLVGSESAQGPAAHSETLYDKTVGLVGYGIIGRIFRQLLRPFGCRVLIYDPFFPANQARADGVEAVPLDRLLREARIVSLHAPDIPETRGMIGAAELALLQEGALLINSARGRLVDTEALTEAARSGRLSAAIDVTEPEPLPPDHPLRSLPNVLMTPHIAGPTTDELPKLAEMAISDLERFLRGEQPLHAITLEAYDRMSF